MLWIKFSNSSKDSGGYDYPELKMKQGRIHDNPVADGWAGAVMRM